MKHGGLTTSRQEVTPANRSVGGVVLAADPESSSVAVGWRRRQDDAPKAEPVLVSGDAFEAATSGPRIRSTRVEAATAAARSSGSGAPITGSVFLEPVAGGPAAVTNGGGARKLHGDKEDRIRGRRSSHGGESQAALLPAHGVGSCHAARRWPDLERRRGREAAPGNGEAPPGGSGQRETSNGYETAAVTGNPNLGSDTML